MSKELTVSNLGDAVRDRVRGAIFASIPDEAIAELIKKEFESMINKGHYNDRRSMLQDIVLAEIKSQVTVRVNAEVKQYLDQTFQTNSKELVEAAVKELAPIFMQSMAQSFAESAVSRLRDQLYNSGVRF